MTAFARMQAQDDPAFAHLSEHLYIRFEACRFRDARVAWLNRRWFVQMGVDLDRRDTQKRVESWLLGRFAGSVPDAADLPEQYRDDPLPLFADRYGSPNGSAHGGSGRVGGWGAFNAKGVGRTPLVSTTSDWYHSHGCMFLEEAVREAILSEVVSRVFPHGAVPTIAIIDTGARLRWACGNMGARRAILVRPAFLRVGGLMRSIYFGTSGTSGADQVADAACVRDMWTGLQPAAWLPRTFERVGAQYGWGNALRLWPGPLFASNVTLDGELVDFGSFRALPSWRRAQGLAKSHGFGGEAGLAALASQSLQRNAERCGVRLNAAALREAFDRGFQRGFEEAADRHGVGVGSPLWVELNAARVQQGRVRTDLTGGDAGHGMAIGALRPWPGLMRERLQAHTEAMIADLGEGPGRDLAPVARFIDQQVRDANPATQSIAASAPKPALLVH